MSDRIKKKHRQLELAVLKTADAVMTISPTFQKDLEKLASRKISLLTNGFDPSDIPLGFSPKAKSPNFLHLVYSGVIDSIRNPIPLMKAMKEEFMGTDEAVQLTFVGKVSEQVREYVLEDPWLKARVNFPGYVSHEEVFRFYAEADALILILTDTKNAQGNIPGKLFEYMATGVPILALGDPKGDSAQILGQSKAGNVVRHEDFVGIQVALRELMDARTVIKEASNLDQFSRRSLTLELARILNEL